MNGNENTLTPDSRMKVLNRDIIKYIAVFVMFWGHLFAWLALMRNPDIADPYDVMPLWQQIISHFALFCPPVMFFFVTDGYKFTRDRKKYALRLLVFACITQIPDWIVFQPVYGWWTSNVIFTLFFGLLAIMAWESSYKKWQRIALVILAIAASLLAQSDWMVFGVVFILLLHIYRDRPKARFTSYMSVALLWKLLYVIISIGEAPVPRIMINTILDLVPVILAYLCMTIFYNGKKGRHPVFAQWFFYAFYPLHYIVIWIVYTVTK